MGKIVAFTATAGLDTPPELPNSPAPALCHQSQREASSHSFRAAWERFKRWMILTDRAGLATFDRFEERVEPFLGLDRPTQFWRKVPDGEHEMPHDHVAAVYATAGPCSFESRNVAAEVVSCENAGGDIYVTFKISPRFAIERLAAVS